MRQVFPALLLASLLPLTAQAQTPVAADPIVLRVESGSVMVSQQGAEFVTVNADVSLRPQDRVLVPEGSVASLDYGSGCSVSLITGAYPVAATCPLATAAVAAAAVPAEVPAAADVPADTADTAAATGTNTGMVVGVVAGVAGLAALAGGGGSSSDSPPPPPSEPPPVSR